MKDAVTFVPLENEEEVYALAVINTVFGGSISSRLFQKIREEKGLVYINGYSLHYDNYLNEYETDCIVTMDTDFYLDLILIKAKHTKYSFLNMSKEVFVKSNPVNIASGKICGQDKKGEIKLLEEI